MIIWSIIFFLLSLVCGTLGFGNFEFISPTGAGILKFLFLIYTSLFFFSLIVPQTRDPNE